LNGVILIYEVTLWLFMVFEAIAGSGTEMYIQAYIATAFLSGLLYLYLSRVWWDNVPLKFPIVHFFIVTWSGIMYLNFLNESLFSSFAWYMDWLISTPLIVLALGMTALHHADKNHYDLLGMLMGLQFMLVVTGIISQSTGATLAYWVGNALLLGVIYLLWFPFREIAEQGSERLAKSYKTLAAYISIFFVLYPAAWYLGTPGPMEVLSDFQTSLAFVVLPFFCKQVYGFLDLYMIHHAEE